MFKKNIKEYLEEEKIKEELLTDNSLLLITKTKDNRIEIKVRYVEMNSIRDNYLIIIPQEETDDIYNRFIINENKTMIAVFEKVEDYYVLTTIYNLLENRTENSEFLDIIYEKEFTTKPLDKFLRLKK
jgi:hypothetical protein